MQRITQLSKSNLMQAERLEIVPVDHDPEMPGARMMLKVWRGDRCAFVCGAFGPLTFEGMPALRRFVRRFRPTLADSFSTI